jgi:hypothetical protein
MYAERSRQLFQLWKYAVRKELAIDVQGSVMSFPFGVRYRIDSLDRLEGCRRPCRGLGQGPDDPAHRYPCSLDVHPADTNVLKKYLRCEYKQLGKKPAWHGQRDIPTEVVSYDLDHTSAPGLERDTLWAQYWFNQHHHQVPRPILRWHPKVWPHGAIPFKRLYILDCTGRPYFGLHPDIVKLLLDFTGRIKESEVHDGLLHPSSPGELTRLMHLADTVQGFHV